MADRPSAGDVVLCSGAEHVPTLLDFGPYAFPHDEDPPYCSEWLTIDDADRIGLCTDADTAYMPMSEGMYERWCDRPCRRGLAFCDHDDPDCRRSLAIALACAGAT